MLVKLTDPETLKKISEGLSNLQILRLKESLKECQKIEDKILNSYFEDSRNMLDKKEMINLSELCLK